MNYMNDENKRQFFVYNGINELGALVFALKYKEKLSFAPLSRSVQGASLGLKHLSSYNKATGSDF